MAEIFKGGVPYGPDRKRLEETFPVAELTEGRVIPHEMLEGVLDLKAGTSRYYGVINSWIAKVKTDHAIILAWQPGDGVAVLDPAGIMQTSESRVRKHIKGVGRGIRLHSYVDRRRLDEKSQQIFDHKTRVYGAYQAASRLALKELPIELGPAKSLPKPKLVAPQEKAG